MELISDKVNPKLKIANLINVYKLKIIGIDLINSLLQTLTLLKLQIL